MTNIISIKKLIAVALGLMVAGAIVFAVLPTVSDITGLSFGAQVAEACCGGDGGGDGPGGAGDDHNPPPPPPPAPVCTLDASPNTIVQGGSSTLTWTTSNATSVSINQGIGSVALDGNTVVSPTQTKTYTLTATGAGGTVTCSDTITVTIPPAPVCTLDASPTTINQGESSTLTWTTDNATSVSINQGIGSVALDGNTSVSPTNTTTYTLTATGNGKTVTCSKTITVIPPPNAPVCTLNANPTTIDKGESSTLTWTTDNAHTVSINQGIGGVALDGNTSVSPNATTTYTLTATGTGGTVTCSATVVVIPPPGAPVCTLTVDPTQVTLGGNSRVDWTSQNVTHVLITKTITGQGPTTFQDTNAGAGSVIITPTATTTYNGTFTGPGGVVTCQAVVTVVPPVVNPLLCTLTANPLEFPFGGGTTTLNWTSDNATSVSIDQGIGGVALDGSQVVPVTTNKTFTLTAVRGDETKQCSVSVAVRPENPPALRCDSFSASPSNLPQGGGDTTLTWATTGATSVSIDQGVGSVPVDGSKGVTVDSSRTFTLTAANATTSVTCTAPVSVETGGGGGGGGGGSSRPVCSLFKASDTTITPGQEITLRWETRRGNELTIEEDGDEIFSTDDDDEVDEGDIEVRPRSDTRYTLTVERGSRRDTCTVNVKTGGPDITVLSARDQQPITTISLTQIPYTGFDAGPTLTALFYTLLALWSFSIAYILVVKRGSVLGFRLPERAHAQGSIIPHAEYKTHSMTVSHSMPVATAPANLPVGMPVFLDTEDTETEEEVEETEAEPGDTDGEEYALLENRAHMQNVLLSSDALRMIAGQGENDEERVMLLDEVIGRAKASFPREDGWLVLNRARIAELFK